MGGTSNLNYMMYLRGHHQDFDNWAQLTGDPVWKYDSVMKYYKKHENFHEPDPNWEINSDQYHAQGGDLTLSLSSECPELAEKFIQAGQELYNFPYMDVNGRFDEGR